MPIEKISRSKVYMKIVEQIETLILNGELKIGNKLPPERELAQKFGVARPTVREALSALQVLGIVDVQVGSGAFVRRIPGTGIEDSMRQLGTESTPFELLEARKFMESVIAKVAANKATSEDLASIEELAEEMRKELREGEFSMESDREFHLRIAKATGNPILVGIAEYLVNMMRGRLWEAMTEINRRIPGKSEKYIEDHHRIFQAIKEKDTAKAELEMYKHLDGGMRDLREDWESERNTRDR